MIQKAASLKNIVTVADMFILIKTPHDKDGQSNFVDALCAAVNS